MRLLPRFREDTILREQLALISENYIFGVLGYFGTMVLATVVLRVLGSGIEVLYWLGANALIVCIVLISYFYHCRQHILIRQRALSYVVSLGSMGASWGILLLLYVPDSLTNWLVLSTMSATLVAGGLGMQSPCLPVFYAFLCTTIPANVLGFYLTNSNTSGAIIAGGIVYFIAMQQFAKNSEGIIKNSIELRFKNEKLISQLEGAISAKDEANQAKASFLAAASHDLRQPLHAIGLFTDSLNATQLDEAQKTIVSHINSASAATRDILNTLLDYSKLNAGVITPFIRPFKLQPMLTELENELAPNADQKNIVYRSRDTQLTVKTDYILLALILRNLISNAINHTSSGGVLLGCRQYQNSLSIEVWDTGVGIAPTELKNIFKEFHQLANPERDREKGFGLGLAIVDGLIKTLGLTIQVESVQNKGCVFKVIVPLAELDEVEYIAPSIDITYTFENSKFLIIDDDESIRQGMASLLNSWSAEVYSAESSAEAIKLITENSLKPDLIITDYRLRDGLTGRQALDDIRALLSTPVPAIIITGDTDPVRFKDASEASALLLHKPLSAEQLGKAISDTIKP